MNISILPGPDILFCCAPDFQVTQQHLVSFFFPYFHLIQALHSQLHPQAQTNQHSQRAIQASSNGQSPATEDWLLGNITNFICSFAGRCLEQRKS